MSTSCHWIPAFPVGVRAVGSLTQRSRQAAGWMYAGVLAGVPPVEAPAAAELLNIFERFRRRIHTKYQGKHFSLGG